MANIRVMIGLLLVVVGFFWNDIVKLIPESSPNPEPVLVINKPDKISDNVSSVAGLVTDKEDRTKLAIFNNVFADRVLDYQTDAQQINDVYSQAAKNMFGQSLRGKYNGYGEGLIEIMKDTLGDENHEVSQEEKNDISQDFKGLAYTLSLTQ